MNQAQPSPAASIIIPISIAEGYIAEAAASMLNQSFRNLELIVLDHGSTDGSLGIAQAVGRQDGRIKLISHENVGLVHTLNGLIEGAPGKCLTPVDADDVSLPDRSRQTVHFRELNTNVRPAGTATLTIEANRRMIGPIHPSQRGCSR